MMKRTNLWSGTLLGLSMTLALAACGGGGGGSSVVSGNSVTALPVSSEAPALVGDIATDGRNWINFRRAQAGIPVMSPNATVSTAAQAHSDYQNRNNVVSHDEVAGKRGYTGIHLLERLTYANYNFDMTDAYAYGEVIAASQSTSGAFMAEELVTAIYHRFVMLEPKFKEIGTGSATAASGYSYFTSDFTANNGYGAGLGKGVVVTWPFNGQTSVIPNFFTDYEEPDPVDEVNGVKVNEVGYPVSVHGDITAVLTVQSFTMHQRGGANLSVKLLQNSSDPHTPKSAMAIIPLAVLKAATTYDVSFSGSADGVAISKTWSFTTE